MLGGYAARLPPYIKDMPHCLTMNTTPNRDFDAEIAAMVALATEATKTGGLPPFQYPVPATSQSPGVMVLSTATQGKADADQREDRG